MPSDNIPALATTFMLSGNVKIEYGCLAFA